MRLVLISPLRILAACGLAISLPIIRNAAFCSGSALGTAAAFAATFSAAALAAFSAGGAVGLSDIMLFRICGRSPCRGSAKKLSLWPWARSRRGTEPLPGLAEYWYR